MLIERKWSIESEGHHGFAAIPDRGILSVLVGLGKHRYRLVYSHESCYDLDQVARVPLLLDSAQLPGRPAVFIDRGYGSVEMTRLWVHTNCAQIIHHDKVWEQLTDILICLDAWNRCVPRLETVNSWTGSERSRWGGFQTFSCPGAIAWSTFQSSISSPSNEREAIRVVLLATSRRLLRKHTLIT